MQRPARKKTEIKDQHQGVSNVIQQFNWRLAYLAAAIIALLLYANTIGHEFTVDDTLVTTKNKFVTQGIAGLDEIFTTPYRAGFWDRKEGLYRPLSVAMFALEWEIAGDKPWLGHLMNILLYAVTAVFTLSVTRKLLRDFSPLVICAISFLFIVHPVHTEVVANIKSRDEILSFLFGLIALFGLLKSEEGNKSGQWMGISLAAFFISLFSKENSLTWIGVFPLALWITTKRTIASIAFKTLPYVAAGALFMFCRYAVLGTMGSDFELLLINNSLIAADTFSERLATSIYILGKYILLLIAPVTLVFDYSYNTIPVIGFGDFRFLLSFIVLGGGLYYALKNLPKRDPAAFGIVFFLGTILLVSNIFILIEATMAERFIYSPSYGFCIAAGVFAGRMLRTTGKNKLPDLQSNKVPVYVFAAILLVFSIRTVARNADWKDNYTLLTKDVKANPGSARIRYAYGSALLFEKAIDEKNTDQKNAYLMQAVEQLKAGVSIIREYNDAWFHLGLAYKELGNAPEAVKAFEEARSLKGFEEAARFSNSGVAYGMAAQYDKAVLDLRKAIEMEPENADHWNNLGLYLSEAGRIPESINALDTALKLKPGSDKAYYNKGNAYAKAGDFYKAMENYKKAIEFNPSSSDALNNTGNCYAALRMPDSALVWFQKAVEANPYNVKAITNLGVTYTMLGDTAKGQEYLNQARSMGL